MMMRKLFEQAGSLVSFCALLFCLVATVYAQDDQATEILHQMSAEIASLDRFIITGDGYIDDRLDAGLIIEHSMDVTMRMNRPNKAMRITNRDAEATKEMYFGSGVFTVYNDTEKGTDTDRQQAQEALLAIADE